MRIAKVQASTDIDAIVKAITRNGVHSLRFSVDGGGIKIKVNGGTWSPPMGTVEVDD